MDAQKKHHFVAKVLLTTPHYYLVKATNRQEVNRIVDKQTNRQGVLIEALTIEERRIKNCMADWEEELIDE